MKTKSLITVFTFVVFFAFINSESAYSQTSDDLELSEQETQPDELKKDVTEMREWDIPNYIAIPISIAGGFLIAYIYRKFYPPITELYLEQNQEFLIYKCVGPLLNALSVLNHSLRTHETYENYRNIRIQIHEEDKKMLDENQADFLRYRKTLEKINSNSVGEVFYHSLMKFFENGQFLISQGYFEYKFFIRACEGLKVVKEYVDSLELDYVDLEIISDGESMDLSKF